MHYVGFDEELRLTGREGEAVAFGPGLYRVEASGPDHLAVEEGWGVAGTERGRYVTFQRVLISIHQ